MKAISLLILISCADAGGNKSKGETIIYIRGYIATYSEYEPCDSVSGYCQTVSFGETN